MGEIENGKKGVVHLDCFIQSIDGIFKTGGYVEIQLKVYVSWIDSRLVYRYVNKGTSNRRNKVSEKQKALIWLPNIILNNTRTKSVIELNKSNSAGNINVKQTASKIKAHLNELFNYDKYEGHDG